MDDTIVIGAGPAGLSAAYVLAEGGRAVTVLERDGEYVGGLSRTMRHRGCRFDIGGHRFFSKSEEVARFWGEILKEELLRRERLSRIYFGGRFFAYPIKPLDALSKLGPVYAAGCVLSYLRARLSPRRPAESLEDWVINSFGEKLHRTFFKSYTEKVWGRKCSEISADWAAQRIKGLSMGALLRQLLRPHGGKAPGRPVIKTLIESFDYPRLGPGQMWERLAEMVEARGGKILKGQAAERVLWGREGLAVETAERRRFNARSVISTMPLRDLVLGLSPPPPEEVQYAARRLNYRDFMTVALIINKAELFPDNWIYIHDPDVRAARIQNYKNWSPALVPDPGKSCVGMEYFCFEGDELWRAADRDLIALAGRELAKLGLDGGAEIQDGAVVRMAKAYPVYDGEYQGRVALIRAFLDESLPGLQLAGRNGMHRYNNQDHAVMTGFLTARNILAGERRFDPWRVNQDALYHEEDNESG